MILLSGWVVGGALVYAMGAHSGPVLPRPADDSVLQSPDPATMVIPVAGVRREALRDSFDGRRSGGRTHEAIDILAPRGTPVLAAVDGSVRKLFTSRAGGLTIYEFDVASRRVYYYAHLDRYRDGLAEGEPLKQGEVIGYVGTSGNAPANTPHLHFAIGMLPPGGQWWKGVAVDPWPELVARGETLESGLAAGSFDAVSK